jgi:hypothetical protein
VRLWAVSTCARERAITAVSALACALAGCNGDRFGVDTATTGSIDATSPAAHLDMAGRWVFASPNRGYCAMTFGGAPGAASGTVAPEGGCPAKFFTSRQWAFESHGLVIRNHLGEPLAQLEVTGGGRLDGRAGTGEAVSLTR